MEIYKSTLTLEAVGDELNSVCVSSVPWETVEFAGHWVSMRTFMYKALVDSNYAFSTCVCIYIYTCACFFQLLSRV